jgi:hypothetical protein
MSRAAAWTTFSLLGIAAWVGATVYVAATSADPSDAGPILRTFALGGGVFIGLALIAGGWELRRSQTRASVRLYHRLALQAVSQGAIRTARRQTQDIGYVHLIFVGVTSALLFTGIAYGEDGPYRVLFGAGFGLVVIWTIYSFYALGRAYAGAGKLLTPLGLTVTTIPTWRPRWSGGGGDLGGRLTIDGERHGRRVRIEQAGGVSVTTVSGRYGQQSVSSADTMASMTGEPARHWRRVRARSGRDGVEVHRTGNGAGRWYLYDLLLAEHLASQAGEPAVAGTG